MRASGNGLTICAELFVSDYVTPPFLGRVVLNSLFYSYNSIVSVPCALALFQAFRGLDIRSGMVTALVRNVAPLTFAVYLIYDHGTLRPLLWQWLNLAIPLRSLHGWFPIAFCVWSKSLLPAV